MIVTSIRKGLNALSSNSAVIIQSIIIQVQGLLDEENREDLIEEICEEYQEIREDYQESLKVLYKAVWRVLKLILVACKKYLFFEINPFMPGGNKKFTHT